MIKSDKAKISIPTNVTSFTDVQRSLNEIKIKLEELADSQDPTSRGEETESEGKIGSFRVIKESKGRDAKAFLELKTEEGWVKGAIGENPIVFKKIETNKKIDLKKNMTELEADDVVQGTSIAQKTIYYEKEDKTTRGKELACTAGACEIVDIEGR